MLKLENIHKSFHGKTVLKNFSLNVPRGGIAVLLGSSGVGKSTVLRILNNLEKVESGTIFLNDKKIDLTKVNKEHRIGMVFQQFNLFDHMTVEQNISFVVEKVLGKSKKDSHKIATDLLIHYGLADKAPLPVSRLSGGQKQRLAIARAVAVRPFVICMDEPTSALDPLLTSHIAQTIQDLANQGYIVLIATHDTSLLEKLHCTIYLMDKGEIVETATSTDFRDNREEYPRISQFVAGITE